ncbi:MAG: fluoride efflux transporter CrcB [Candidatus Lutibacillus vidarii]|nr:fluoride efflux transporter CrcB [Dermatophilaceae bacterium]
MTLVLVLVGGALGAPVRYLVDRWVSARHDSVLPWGTFTVNMAGSFILGVIAATVVVRGGPGWLLTVAGTGFCGALTTFSTFGYETFRLVEDGAWRQAAASVVGSVVVGMGAVTVGWAAGSALGSP